MLDWGINRIAVENATSNNFAIDHLKIVKVGKVDCIADHDFIHMRCIVNILNIKRSG